MPASPSIVLRQLGYRLPCGRPLFDQLQHTFPAQRIGLVGPNGAGKSVLAALLAGHLTPTSGAIERYATVRHVAQNVRPRAGQHIAALAGWGPLWDAMQRIAGGAASEADYAAMDGNWHVPAALEQALQTAGIRLPPAAPAATLSGGQAMRVALAGALLADDGILLLDEPGNHLDRPARAWLAQRLRAWQGTAIVISHDRALLDDMDSIVELDGGRLRSYGGNYSAYATQRAGERQAAQAALEHARNARANGLRELRQQHDRQQARAARNARAAREENTAPVLRGLRKSAAQAFAGREQRRQDDTRAALDLAVRAAAAAVGSQPGAALMLPAARVAAGQRVLLLEGAVAPWPAHAAPLDLCLAGPVRLAIAGPNGCGKSTLLRMLAGQVAPLRGRCEASVPHAWLDQHSRHLLADQASVLDALQALRTPLPEGVLRSHLALLGIGAAQAVTPAAALSGGERLKGALACALWQAVPAQLLLLDEPTNHLDLASVEALELALQAYPGALAAASHDERFLHALRPTHRLDYRDGRWLLSYC